MNFSIVASDHCSRLADWMELKALTDSDGSSSQEDLVRAIRVNGSLDASDFAIETDWDFDSGSEMSQGLAESAWTTIQHRSVEVGDNYPFDVEDSVLQGKPGAKHSCYAFLLLLSHLGLRLDPSVARIFEAHSACALAGYLNGEAHRFGFPREGLPSHFGEAIKEICRKMHENAPKPELAGMPYVKDGKLDVIGWKHFNDRKTGKIVAFGQCSTSISDVKRKASELDSETFCALFLRDQFIPRVVPAFFVPQEIQQSEWREIQIYAKGLLFDRNRIACHAGPLPPEWVDRHTGWIDRALEQVS